MLLREHILANTQKSINWTHFRDRFEIFVNTSFPAEEATTIRDSMNWTAWIYDPGLAPVHLDFTTPALNESSGIADGYITLAG